jgi:hypothetical protein
MVFDLGGGKKIDLGLPSFQTMMKGKGLTLLPTKKSVSITNGIKPINLGSSFDVRTKSRAPAKTSKNDIIGIGGGLKNAKKKVFRTNPSQIQLPKATNFNVGKLEQDVKPTAEAIRKQAFDQLDRNRGQGLEEEGTARGVRSGERFAFGIQDKPIRDRSVISNREFEFFTMDSGVLQRKAFRSKTLAEAQRRKAEAQGDLEFVSTVRAVPI